METLKIQSLQHAPIEDILNCFNEAFSDYDIPFQMNIEQLEKRVLWHDIDFNLSIGAFKGQKLIGFIWHGMKTIHGKKWAYNSGTGVIPKERGKGLTKSMYAFGIDMLYDHDINGVILEVLSNNKPAIKSYEAIGFKLTRSFNCYSGLLNKMPSNTTLKIACVKKLELDAFLHFNDVNPSWQCSNKALRNAGEAIDYYVAYKSGKVIGFCAYNPANNRILQIAVNPQNRRSKVASSIIAHIRKHQNPKASIINVDKTSESLIQFIQSTGLEKTIVQDEMNLILK